MDKPARFKDLIFGYFTLLFIVLTSTVILWGPFLLKLHTVGGLTVDTPSFNYIYRNYDGPLYIVPAKTLYDPARITALHLETTLPAQYFAAHLPAYPFLIRILSPLAGYLKSMVLINIIATCILAALFYLFLSKLKLTPHPLILSAVFLFLPRFLVVRSVGAPESLFLLFVIASLFSFEKKRYLLAGLFGGLATMTKTPGILLFPAYVLVFIEEWLASHELKTGWFGVILIPLGLLAVFGIYGKQYGDFFAYFHSGDNVHLVAPFSVFNFQKIWVGTAWLEDILFYFFLYGLTVLFLWRSTYRSFFYFTLVFFTATVFIQHRDISRYSLPLWPMAAIAFERFFTSKKFLLIAVILLPAIYLYAWNFLLFNVMPIANWAPFL